VLECPTAAGNDYDGKVAAAEFDMMVELAAKNVRRLNLEGFTAHLLVKYVGMCYGYEDMKHGAVQFGNSDIKSDRCVPDVVGVKGRTSDMDKVKAAVESMNFLKSFTIMAQHSTERKFSCLLAEIWHRAPS